MIFGFLKKRREQKIRMDLLTALIRERALRCTDVINLEGLVDYVLNGRVDDEALRRKFPVYDEFCKQKEKEAEELEKQGFRSVDINPAAGTVYHNENIRSHLGEKS